MIVPPFIAGIFARQLDVSSLISAGVSVASSLLPEITSALSVQLTVIPDSTGGRSTAIVAVTSAPSTPRPATATTTSVRSTTTPVPSEVSSTFNTVTSITSAGLLPVSSSPASGISQGTASGEHHSSKVGLIVGVVVGAIAALLLLFLIFCCLRRRKQGKKNVSFFGKRRGSSSTISKDSDFGDTGPAVRSKDLETTQNYRTNPTVPIPALVSGRRSASPADNPFDDSKRSPPLHRSTLDPVTETPEGYNDQYTDGYGWGNQGAAPRRGGRLAGVGHQRKPTPDPNSEPGRTHFGLLDYETPPPSRGIGLNSGVSNGAHDINKPVQDNQDASSYYGRSWDEVDAVTKKPPPAQPF